MSEKLIREAALTLFAKKGYEATTIREIGKEVGIRGSSIYAHFESKEQLFLEVASHLLKQIAWQDIETACSSDENISFDLKTTLYTFFKHYYCFFADHPTELLFWQRIRFFPPAALEETCPINHLLYSPSVFDTYSQLFERAITLKQIKGRDIHMLVMTFFVFLSGYTDSLIIMPSRFSDKELQTGFDLFWNGLNAQ
ncbi:MAG: transcriptional regulator, TetR family [Clostridia bacterium]|nr:transcriptional regulator, TetR family [Clostridia bacterium]